MKIVILSRKYTLYSTSRLIEEIKIKGHEVMVLDHLKCYMLIEKAKPTIHYNGQDIIGVDAIIPRIGASVTAYGSSVVRQFEMMNVFSANESQAINRSRDKLRSLQLLSRAGIGIPKTAFAQHPKDIDDLIEQVGGAPIIIKLLEGTQGIGVVMAETKKAAKSVIEAFYGLKANILVQEYIKESNGADIRCLVVDGKVVGAMLRQGMKGEFRSNLHRGGKGKLIELTEAENDMAVKAAEILDLSIAGVDMLQSRRGPLIIEVNSSPGLEGIEKATGLNIAEKIIEFVERNAKYGAKRYK